jgi:hypothetical protein
MKHSGISFQRSEERQSANPPKRMADKMPIG